MTLTLAAGCDPFLWECRAGSAGVSPAFVAGGDESAASSGLRYVMGKSRPFRAEAGETPALPAIAFLAFGVTPCRGRDELCKTQVQLLICTDSLFQVWLLARLPRDRGNVNPKNRE